MEPYYPLDGFRVAFIEENGALAKKKVYKFSVF